MDGETRELLFKVLELNKHRAKYPGLFECKEEGMQEQLADIVDKARVLISEDIKETFKYEFTNSFYEDEWKLILDEKDKCRLVIKIYYSDSNKKQYLEHYWNNMDKLFERLQIAYDELHKEDEKDTDKDTDEEYEEREKQNNE